VREAKPKTRDEITLFLGGGWFPRFSCCQRRRSLCSPSWTALKERAAASVVKARSPHRSSCRRHATQRRPSTEIRLGVNFALPAHGPSPTTFFVLREAFSSKRDPPEATEWSQYKPHPCLTRGACTDKEKGSPRTTYRNYAPTAPLMRKAIFFLQRLDALGRVVALKVLF
jgi:hypothetical protein